jgi:hypothetical protein
MEPSAGARGFTKNYGVNSLSEGMSIANVMTRFGPGADAPTEPRTP